MSRQTSKKMVKEICHHNISSVAKQRNEYRRRDISQQKIACRDRTREECNKSVEIKKVNVATRFFHWMSTPGRTCRDTGNRKKAKILSRHWKQEESGYPVATLETGRKWKSSRDKVFYVAIRN